MGLTNKQPKDYANFQPVCLQLVENESFVSLALTSEEASDLLDRLLMSGEEDNATLTSVLRKLIDAMPA